PGHRDEHDARPGPARGRIDPERQIEQDAGSAGEGEQCEDEADEGGVDAEPRRHPSAHAGDHAIAARDLEEPFGPDQPPARTTSIRPAPTSATIVSRPLSPVRTVALRPLSLCRNTCTSPTFARASTTTSALSGTMTRR